MTDAEKLKEAQETIKYLQDRLIHVLKQRDELVEILERVYQHAPPSSVN